MKENKEKIVYGITKKEVKLTQCILDIYNFGIDNNFITIPLYQNDENPLLLDINCKHQIMIKPGSNIFYPSFQTLFRPLISKSICDYLLERLYLIKSGINIYLGEDNEKNFTIRIIDITGQELSYETNKNYKKCVIQTIFNINFYDKQDYCDKIREILTEL